MKKSLLSLLCVLSMGAYAQTTNIYEDEFEFWNTVETLPGQLDIWEAWSCNDYGPESVKVSDEVARSGTQAIKLSELGSEIPLLNGPSDIVLDLGENTTGTYGIHWYMHVPESAGANFSLLYSWGCNGSNTEYGTEVNFSEDGFVYIGSTSSGFPFPQGEWFLVSVEVDIDAFEHTVTVFGNVVHQGFWSAPGGTNKFQGINFSAYSPDMNDNGLFYIDDMLVTQTITSSVEDNRIAELSVYPNPAPSTARISGLHSGASVRVMDLAGKVVFEDMATAQRMDINTSQLAEGIYIVQELSANRTRSIKLTVQQ